MSNTYFETDAIILEIEKINKKVQEMLVNKQQKASPSHVASSFSPPASPARQVLFLDEVPPPKPSDSPDLSRIQRKTPRPQNDNPCAQVQDLRGLFTPPSSPAPKKTKLRSADLAPFSQVSPGRN
jgi:hypothetical protein